MTDAMIRLLRTNYPNRLISDQMIQDGYDRYQDNIASLRNRNLNQKAKIIFLTAGFDLNNVSDRILLVLFSSFENDKTLFRKILTDYEVDQNFISSILYQCLEVYDLQNFKIITGRYANLLLTEGLVDVQWYLTFYDYMKIIYHMYPNNIMPDLHFHPRAGFLIEILKSQVSKRHHLREWKYFMEHNQSFVYYNISDLFTADFNWYKKVGLRVKIFNYLIVQSYFKISGDLLDVIVDEMDTLEPEGSYYRELRREASELQKLKRIHQMLEEYNIEDNLFENRWQINDLQSSEPENLNF